MAYANIKATLASDIRKVWDTVTDLKDWSWRSGLDRIEVLSDTQFVEYTEDGFATTFTVTLKERYKRWEFDMENKNIKGHWTGIFYDQMGRTTIDFTEKVTVKKFYLRPVCRKVPEKSAEVVFFRSEGKDGGIISLLPAVFRDRMRMLNSNRSVYLEKSSGGKGEAGEEHESDSPWWTI